VHAGMVRLDGEKMSKSLGNLVFVSRLLADGHDPMAVRLAILAHHYRRDWDWTDAGLSAATDRLARWREAVQVAVAASSAPAPASSASATAGPESAGRAPASGPSSPGRGEAVLAAMRERLADDLDAPGALAVVDGWAGDALMGAVPPADSGAGLVRDAVDALLGVAL
jgi:L-cysteine:1D-myo-inositol 2-amino-2-deoxy-alpha-D-glucopyranoside ligase